MNTWLLHFSKDPSCLSGPALLVRVAQVQGSVPREVGACMLVTPERLWGTIGGGHLELQAQQRAVQALQKGEVPAPLHTVLGPSLGQCCGGAVSLQFEAWSPQLHDQLLNQEERALRPLALFGAGHVGLALVRVLSELPFALRWIDSRDEPMVQVQALKVPVEYADPVQAAVADLVPGSDVLIMSFSHDEDFHIVKACLDRLRRGSPLGFVGLIGSKTKWASFKSRLRQRGYSDAEMDRITCPIGLPSITGKAPEVIAVSVAAQLLTLSR
jgi:xanthine dehydrogenase accessory factor